MRQFIQKMPKTELHVHLEGAVPVETVWQLLRKYGDQEPFGSLEELKSRYQYKDFSHFLNTWVWQNSYFREYEDFQIIGEAVARDLVSQNIRYAEAFYSPLLTSRLNLDPIKITEALRRGLDAFRSQICVNLILDFSRDQGPSSATAALKEIGNLKELGVIGIGIGGSEHEFPPEPFEPVFRMARAMGYNTTAHAGEAAGADSIWGALNTIKVDRIGHGTRAFEDPNLVNYIIEEQIPVEMCPLSNCRTGVVPRIKEHPIESYFNKNMLVTVNTDDPKMFNSSLSLEFETLATAFNWGKREIIQLASNSINASWADSSTKKNLQIKLQNYAGLHKKISL